ncbi:Carboxypeptidase Y A [Gossypium arboreum]|uniref:Carboxypeptidase Y A n=1 Tax=Gossypium arboreum TaxID=29729 RepID=A0A0B0MK14_GOSAR|nr:Carboxypeptidase Y A [Gossypium arboreum]
MMDVPMNLKEVLSAYKFLCVKSHSSTKLGDTHVAQQTTKSKGDTTKLVKSRHDLLYKKRRIKLQGKLHVGGLDDGENFVPRSCGNKGTVNTTT